MTRTTTPSATPPQGGTPKANATPTGSQAARDVYGFPDPRAAAAHGGGG